MTQSVRLAIINYKNDKKSYRLFSLLLIVCLTSVFLLILFANGFVKLENNYKKNNVSLREIQMWPQESDGDVVLFDEKKNESIADLSGVEKVSQYFNIVLQDTYVVLVDDFQLNCNSYIRGVNRHFSFAPMSEIQKKGVTPIVAGRTITDSNDREALIDENMCYLLGYDSPEHAIGKKIKIILSDKTISDIEIVGVYSYHFSDYGAQLSGMDRFSRKSTLEGFHSNPFYYSDGLLREIVSSKDVIWWSYENLIVLCESTDSVKRICDYAQNTCGYSYDSSIDTINKLAERVRAISVFLISLISIVLLIALIVILNSLSVKILHQRHFTEMLIKIGFQKGDIIKSYIWQNLLVSLKAGGISGIVAFIIGICIDGSLQSIYQDISEKTKFVFFIDVPSSLVIVGAFCLLIVMATWVESTIQIAKMEGLGRAKHG